MAGCQHLVWWISLLAIVTSVIGVGIGLYDTIKEMLSKLLPGCACNIAASILTILPAYLVAVLVPNAFIAVAGFAGMILAVIAILLPVYLFYQIKSKTLFYPGLKYNWLIFLSIGVAFMVIVFEIFNMISL